MKNPKRKEQNCSFILTDSFCSDIISTQEQKCTVITKGGSNMTTKNKNLKISATKVQTLMA